MKTQLLSFAILSFALLWLPAGENTNPSLYYWQGAALLPKLDEESARQLQAMASLKKPFDTTQFSSKDYQSTSVFLRKGAHSTQPCDWGLDMEDGVALMMPHLSKIRELHAVAVCLALEEFSKGEPELGVDWLLVSHRVARHGGAGDTLISWLVYSAMEKSTLNVAALHCLKWPKSTRENYGAILGDQPHSSPSLSDATKGELLSRISWLENLSKDRSEFKAAATAAGLDPSQDSPEALSSGINELKNVQTSLQDVLTQQGSARSAGLAELDKLISGSPSYYVKTLMPGTKLFAKDLELDTRVQMLQALLQKGPEISEADVSTLQHLLTEAPTILDKTAGEITLRCGGIELQSMIR